MSYLTITIFMGMSYLFLVLEEITNRPKKILKLLIISAFIVLVSFRSLTIPDTYGYASSYQYLRVGLSNIFMSYYETGFAMFSMLIKMVAGSNYRLFFGVIAVTNLFLVNKLIKKYNINLTIMPLLIYLSFYGFYQNYVVLRAGIAFTLLLYAWATFGKNKIASLFLFFLASSFHLSALIGILGYLVIIRSRKISTKVYLIWLFAIISLYFLRIDVFIYDFIIETMLENGLFNNHRFLYYINNIRFIEGVSYRFLLNYLVAIFLIFTNKNKPNFYNDLLNIYMIGMTIVAFFSSFVWIERLTDFFIATNFILIPIAINTFKDKYIRIIICLPIIALNVLFVLRIMSQAA